MVQIGNEWDEILKDEFQSDYYAQIRETLKQEYASHEIYPPMQDIFNALRYTSYSDVKAVLLGQDPYHGPGQAHGLCFSVRPGVAPPPSLQNIFKELQSDMGLPAPHSGCLIPWAKEGVLMLNTTLTVRRGQANSHSKIGWTKFTDAIIQKLNDHEQPIVFLLWGSNARSKKALITNPNHLILETVHPSPLSAHQGFFGSRHFSQCNEFLMAHGIAPIDWTLE
ncbi:uracil-DNA glycosylase [Butyricicoccus pullicaecorum]|uniref:Uracil-DNA glycosylase n=2 Tax=Butyricicoccus pullicaecorum TaxID=501571 RepID=R8W0M6_9FIRM|nr:uracil-DNA glycosylase [Butyricicoccus pullicaecorum]EOQ38490.1 uracil-DNA glycosylase [Butyricicoccus pullicaecorum 1.2]OUP52879.1 uracil-DNA glycosylase [Butyricicoccus pullicaecorum]OUP57386.1 uracil-DNA glycosylase [Butyricicoccus pullicaecorum]SKA53609.1 Uracil-DNA glycosylase [Butyricicoccus pullicaecorum DSM 23266]